MKNTHKWVLTAFSTFGIVWLIFLISRFFGGPNDYIEQYEFDINKLQLIEVVKVFKKQNLQYVPPLIFETVDTLDKDTQNFDVYFYDKNKNTVMYCFISSDPSSPDKSSINLSSINKGMKSWKYQAVNKDLKNGENETVKKDFRTNVLDKLKLPYTDKGYGFSRLW